ncbi:ABC superfamily ATP binding cassette transporter, amino-acid binding protein [Bifidobacterium pullorum subsp. gallinarum]|uniref:ABC superfamily ATP binding cassette transporter, amino-acid binding protein n=1 Tax=Bifidobacterium pullorum subsp. gallinarum TaxID=78344 RepID=A0A087ANK5_9BIFI|nr:ABC transporter substrate-binding protein [Bifidobacterium pullorum]KFI60355.1 ABC superfamily ATP binding cassette transporter, amino-acid binding protein [Bifidobacterium pullorum subsp. gallinarum]
MTISGKQFIRGAAATLSIAALALTAACGSDTAQDAADNTQANSGDLTQQTVTPGKLTIATGDPAYEPWVLNDDPESGEGYEAAVAYAVAEQLGFDADDVVWTRTTFDAAIAPGPKDWDMNIQQFGITDERKQAVDFSSGYYKDTRAVIVKKDGKFANATSLADLKDAVVGATVGTQGYTYAKEKINDNVQTFNDDASLAQALDAGQIDALVADTTVCVYMVQSGQVADGVVIGRIAGSEDKDGMGIVLPKDSPLTEATTKAVDDLEADGTLQKLQDQWLAEYTSDLPELA